MQSISHAREEIEEKKCKTVAVDRCKKQCPLNSELPSRGSRPAEQKLTHHSSQIEAARTRLPSAGLLREHGSREDSCRFEETFQLHVSGGKV